MKKFLALLYFAAICNTLSIRNNQHSKSTSPQIFGSSKEMFDFLNSKKKQQQQQPKTQSTVIKTVDHNKKKLGGIKATQPFVAPKTRAQEHPQYLSFEMRTNITDPYLKIYYWAIDDIDLSQAIYNGFQLNPDQQFKINQYMVNDQYFQQDLIQQLSITSDNKWVGQLSPRAQVRFVKLLGNIKQNDVQDPSKVKKIEQKLANDYDIGPEYNNFVKQNPKLKPLEEGYKLINFNYI